MVPATDLIIDFTKFASQSSPYFTGIKLVGTPGSSNGQEWAVNGEIDGKSAKVVYQFTDEEVMYNDPESLPCDLDHVHRIEKAM